MAIELYAVDCLGLRKRVGIANHIRFRLQAHEVEKLKITEQTPYALNPEARFRGDLMRARGSSDVGVELKDASPHAVLVRVKRVTPSFSKTRPGGHAPAEGLVRPRRSHGRPVWPEDARPDFRRQ